MTSEIRVNKLQNRVGLGTVEYTNTGIVVSGIVTCTELSGLTALNIAGVGTASTLDINGDIDVDGHTNLDNVSVAGVTTFSGSNVNITGELKIENTSPVIRLVDTNQNPDYWIQNHNGGFRIYDTTNTADRFTIHSDGHVDIFGNLDCLSGIDVTGNATVSGTLGSGDITITSNQPKLSLTDSSNNPDWSVKNANGNFAINDETAGATRFSINSSNGVEFHMHAVPITDSTYDLGLTGTRFRAAYVDTYYGDGSNLTGIDATQIVTGNTSVQTVDTGSDGHVKITTEGSERLRIDSGGKILSGHTAALTKFHGPASTTKRNPHIQVNGTNVNSASMSLTSWDNNVNGYYGPAIYLAKSGSSTIGTNSRVSNQLSILGSIIFSGDDGDEFVKGAMIQGAVDGGVTTGNNDMPGRLLFLTTKDGAQEPIERLRIDSTGAIMLMQDSNESSAQQKLQWISNSGSLSAQAAWGQGSANFDFSVFRSDSQTDYPYGNFRVLTGGTSPSESLKVTVGGQVLKPRQPAFRAQGNTHYPNQTSDFSLVYNNEIFDRGSNYDPSNGRFTAPVSGRYYFYYCYLVYPDNDNYWKTMGFTINGSSSYAHGFARGDRNSQNSMQVSTFLDLSANDYVQPHIQISSGTLDFYMTGGHAHFYGWLVS